MRSTAIAFAVLALLGAAPTSPGPAVAQGRLVTDPKTASIEEKLAGLNAGRLIRSDDITIARFRFLLNALAAASGEDRERVGDVLYSGHKMLREKYGKDVTLLQFFERAYQDRGSIKKMTLPGFTALLVVMIGAG